MNIIKRLSAPEIYARKASVPLVCLTAYTTPMAQIMDPHCDILLVGDSLGMVVHGLPNTLGVTMEMMILHAQAVMRGSNSAFVVVDLPFGAYEQGPEQAYQNAVRILKETGAQGVKLESGPTVADTIKFLTMRGIPTMGHVGLRPQAVNMDGGFKAKGRTQAERQTAIDEAIATDEAGVFAIVVEGVAEDLASEITKLVKAPTIGIGASKWCDGQILVTEDMLGMMDWSPKFARKYANLRGTIEEAVKNFALDVKNRDFPAPQETYFSK